MAGLKAIKSKIRSIEKTRKVTKAMEAVSAAKMRKAQVKALAGRAYARAAVSILARVSGSRELGAHPLTQKRDIARMLYIVITSDKGLAGALNSGVLRAAHSDITKQTVAPSEIGIIAVGRKAKDFFTARGFQIVSYHENTDEGVPRELVQTLVNEAAERFSNGEYDAVKVVYQHFGSTFEQVPKLRTLFPLSLHELEKIVRDIVPARGKYADAGADEKNPSTYTIEPSEKEVLDAVVPKLAAVFVYHALLESRASEHSARMVAMKSASDKGKELSHGLTLQFNKARQAAITREVSEITGGIEAMAT